MLYMRSHKWEARPWTKYPESQTFTLVPVWITQVLQVKLFSWQTLINSGMGPNSIYKNDLLWTYLYTVLCLLICLCGTLLSSLRGTNLFMLCDIFNVFLNSVCNHFIKDLWKLIHIVFVVITSLSGIGIRIAAFMGWVWCVVFDFMESFENYFCQLFFFSPRVVEFNMESSCPMNFLIGGILLFQYFCSLQICLNCSYLLSVNRTGQMCLWTYSFLLDFPALWI